MEVEYPAQVAKGALYLFIRGFIGQAVGVIYLAFATRILSVEEIGVVSALAIVSVFFLTVGTLELPSAATKYISESLGRNRPDIARGVYGEVFRFGVLFSSLLSLLCFIASTTISTLIFGSQTYQLLINLLALDIFALILSSFFIGTLLGLQKFKGISLIGLASICLRYGVGIYLLTQGMAVVGIVLGWLIADFIQLGLLFVFTSTSFKTEATSPRFRELLRYSMPLYASRITRYFSVHIDRFIILFFAGFTTLGIYTVAVTATSVIGLLSMSMGNSLFPRFCELYGRHKRGTLKMASMKASRYIFFIYMPLAVGLAATGYPTILLFFGARYESGWLPLAIISIAMALTCAEVVVGSILMTMGFTRVIFEANILAMVIGAAFSVVLVGSLGVVGVALARAALIITFFTYFAYKLSKIFSLDLDSDAFKKSLLSSVIMAAVVAFAQFMLFDVYMLPLYILVGGVVYILMLRILKAVSEEDIKLFHELLPKRLGGMIDIFARFIGIKTKPKNYE